MTNSFGLANWTGLAATVIAVGLLAISSDFALRKHKAGPWKWLQRLNYTLFALVIVQAIYYGALLRLTSPSTLLLGLSAIAVFIITEQHRARPNLWTSAVESPRIVAVTPYERIDARIGQRSNLLFRTKDDA